MKSKLLSVLLLFVCSSALGADKDTVAKAIKADKMTVQDCRKWYTIYKGAYIYVKDLNAVGSNDFGDVFDKMRVVRDVNLPSKGNVEWIKATDLSTYAEAEFSPEKKTDLAEDLYQICEGLKAGMK
jgi:hypothetical protein